MPIYEYQQARRDSVSDHHRFSPKESTERDPDPLGCHQGHWATTATHIQYALPPCRQDRHERFDFCQIAVLTGCFPDCWNTDVLRSRTATEHMHVARKHPRRTGIAVRLPESSQTRIESPI